MGQHTAPILSTALAACAMADIGTNQANWFPPARAQHHLAATLLIVVGEVVKLTLFEQLFDMTRPKLMSFRWFAWGYGRWRAALEYVRSLPVWRKMLRCYRTVRAWALRWRIS